MPAKKKPVAKAKRGPAPGGEYVGKSSVLSTRITADLREWLEKAAKTSGRTLSQEIENRLRETFREEKELSDRFGTYRTALILQVVALVLNAMRNPENPNAEWLDDPHAFQLAKDAINHTLDAIRPKEPTNPFLAYGLDITQDPEGASLATWRDIARLDTALPLGGKTTGAQSLGRLVKNKFPEIVERASERANALTGQRLFDDQEPAPLEEINKVRAENYFCDYCGGFGYPKDQGRRCPTCKGIDRLGLKHGLDGQERPPLEKQP
jgi:hypothetical protein